MGRKRKESEGSEREICEYVVQYKVKINGKVETLSRKSAHFGYTFTNYGYFSARVINKTKGLIADLPPGTHFGDDLDWKRF